jgi:uncharacterized protein YhbP (UPF0306 family)
MRSSGSRIPIRSTRATSPAPARPQSPSSTRISPDRGIQLFGTAAVTTGKATLEARRIYGRRFRDYDADADDLPAYRFRPRTVKLFDERSLAGGTLVTARVTPDGLVWSKTEVWA